jgi:hypothetical protein
MTYALENAWGRAERRLALLEQHLDPMSERRLLALGVGKGWQCLEVGAGRGSVARWLCHQVDATGHVMATDIDTRFLREIREDNFEASSHDIMAEELPQRKFDLVHARWLLHHRVSPESDLMVSHGPLHLNSLHSNRACWWTIERGIDRQPEMDTSSYRLGCTDPASGSPRQNDPFFGPTRYRKSPSEETR